MVSKRVRRTPTTNSTPPVRIAGAGGGGAAAATVTAVVGTNSSPVPGGTGTPRNTRGVPEDLLALTKEQLKVECRKRGQKTTGTKTELLQRLGHKMSTKRGNASASSPSSTSSSSGTATTNGSAMQQQSTQSKQSLSSSDSGQHHHHYHHSGASRHQQKMRERDEREGIVLWRRPITTMQYAFKESFILLNTYGQSLFRHKLVVVSMISTVLLIVFLRNITGPHQAILQLVYKQIMWCSYWIGLGILSSVGLGTGLHTFLLYLGPHIAQVTLAAYECGSLNFPEPPYPDEIICPNEVANPVLITIFAIMSKVRLESMCWGAGTALGELPPYFMARAARLSGMDPDDDDDDLAQIEQLQKKKKEELTLVERGKLFVEHIVQKVGFFGILACASIPNPLFDLAGITCGHFLVPFWTFFGATLIGKAIVKMHIQKLFVIVAFNETLINSALDLMRTVPLIGGRLVDPFKAFLDGQKERLHSGSVPDANKSGAGRWIGAIFEKFVVLMICYFLVSIVNSAAQSYHKRITRKKAVMKHAKD